MARRTYSIEFKQEAVRLVREQGLTAAQVGRDLDVCKSVIRAWLRKAEEGSLGGLPTAPSSPTSLEEEVRRLRKENSILREEREILKKAAAFFAKETR
jgi:transposase